MKIARLFLFQLLNWTRVLPEIAIASIIIFFSRERLDFPIAYLLFLSSATILRFSWNSATLIHGLGHAIAIATCDRLPSAFNITNILEERRIGTTLRSLLPFSPIFIPGCDCARASARGNRTSDLWVAAGDATPWRIRIKAIGGIGFNLLAIIILLLLLPNSLSHSLTSDRSIVAFYCTFLIQTFLGANLLIILSSWSDIAALVTGVAEVFFAVTSAF